MQKRIIDLYCRISSNENQNSSIKLVQSYLSKSKGKHDVARLQVGAKLKPFEMIRAEQCSETIIEQLKKLLTKKEKKVVLNDEVILLILTQL